jgi:hypothetical protein
MNQHGHDQPIHDLHLTAPHDQHGHDEFDEPVQDTQDELDEPVDDNLAGYHFSVNLTLSSCCKMTYQAR